MSIIAKKIYQNYALDGIIIVDWLNMSAGDEGEPIELANHHDISVQVWGTFSGASVALQGTNHFQEETPAWTTVLDSNGVPMSFSTAGVKQVLTAMMKYKPVISGGDGVTAINVRVKFARARSAGRTG